MTDINEIDAALEKIDILCPHTFDSAEFFFWVCTFKYLVRLGPKDPTLEDIKKAEYYLQKLREMLEKKISAASHSQGRTIEETIEGTSQGPKRPPPIPNPKPPNRSYGYTPTVYRKCDGAPPPEPPSRD